MKARHLLISLIILSLGILSCAPTPTPLPGTPAAKVKLVLLTHWGEESLLKAFQAKLDEYMKLNPNVTIEYQTVTFDQLLSKILTAHAAGATPDVLHFYNLWLPEFVKGGMLDEPPADVVADIQANYSKSSIEAVSYQGKIWGYPTEINTYLLIYNKKMLQEAGYNKPPETWDQLKEMACKLTQVDSAGKVTRAGIVLITGWDSGVVHPFISLLWSNGGEYLSPDGKKALFNSPEGLATLQLYMDLIQNKCTDLGIRWDTDFPNGKGAMIIMANWWRATLKETFKDGYENVGVAPIPHGPKGTSRTLQYNWLFGVSSTTKHREEAWKLVKWLNTPPKEGQASPIGDFLTSALGAIPSRISDQKALADRFDAFLQAYVDSLAVARPEPVVLGAQEVKTILQREIEAAWFGQKAPETALTTAAEEANRILAERQR